MTPRIGRLACAMLIAVPLLTAAPARAAAPGELTALDIGFGELGTVWR